MHPLLPFFLPPWTTEATPGASGAVLQSQSSDLGKGSQQEGWSSREVAGARVPDGTGVTAPKRGLGLSGCVLFAGEQEFLQEAFSWDRDRPGLKLGGRVGHPCIVAHKDTEGDPQEES